MITLQLSSAAKYKARMHCVKVKRWSLCLGTMNWIYFLCQTLLSAFQGFTLTMLSEKAEIKQYKGSWAGRGKAQKRVGKVN